MKKILMATAAVLSLSAGTALAQMQSAPTDQDQNRQTQSVPDKGPQQTAPQGRPMEKPGSQMQRGDESKPMGGIREEQRQDVRGDQDQNVREERHEQGGAARITPTRVLSGGDRDRMETVIRSGSAPRVDNLRFSVRVGVAIPRTIRVVPVPQEIVAIYPQWSGFLYFVSGDEVIVVDPNSYAVVGVLEA